MGGIGIVPARERIDIFVPCSLSATRASTRTRFLGAALVHSSPTRARWGALPVYLHSSFDYSIPETGAFSFVEPAVSVLVKLLDEFFVFRWGALVS